MQISFVMLAFSDQISGRGKDFQGEQTASGGRPPVEESQCSFEGRFNLDGDGNV